VRFPRATRQLRRDLIDAAVRHRKVVCHDQSHGKPNRFRQPSVQLRHDPRKCGRAIEQTEDHDATFGFIETANATLLDDGHRRYEAGSELHNLSFFGIVTATIVAS